jgi:hypothetical protein
MPRSRRSGFAAQFQKVIAEALTLRARPPPVDLRLSLPGKFNRLIMTDALLREERG